MVNEIISAILQVLVFTLIPLIVFLITKRKFKGFFEYIGLKPTTKKAIFLALATSSVFIIGGVCLSLFSVEIREIMINPPSVTGKLREMGLSPASIFTLLLIAWVKTSFAEEILFRGFIAKRLVNWLGFQIGNILQALIFALVHVLLFWAITNAGTAFLVFIFFLSGIAGCLMEFINEKFGEGSIIPSWLAHALGNTVSYFIIAFLI